MIISSHYIRIGGLPPGLSNAVDQMKEMGMAPHLNPTFLQEMAAQGNAGAKQNMVNNKECVICCINFVKTTI